MTVETNRIYSTRRLGIVESLADKLKEIDGNGDFNTDIYRNVTPRLKFWDEVDEFPSIHLNAGSESRAYQSGGYKDRFLTVTVRVYVREEDSVAALEMLLEDIETVIENNSRLEYYDRRGDTQYTQQISIVSIDTDEGVMEPLGIGEVLLEVRY
jgi:hypothetical protein